MHKRNPDLPWARSVAKLSMVCTILFLSQFLSGQMDQDLVSMDHPKHTSTTTDQAILRAISHENNVILRWSSFFNNKKGDYIIEYSSDGISYKLLGEVNIKTKLEEPSNYSFIHKNAVEFGNQNLYYRISKKNVEASSGFVEAQAQFEFADYSSNLFHFMVEQGKEMTIKSIAIKKIEIMSTAGDLLGSFKYDSSPEFVFLPTKNLSKGLHYVMINDKEVLRVLII